MLVLRRRLGEKIVISEEIVVEINAVQGNRVRLGISAPKEVRVRRGELVPLAQQENHRELELSQR